MEPRKRHFVHPAERDTKACGKGVDRLKNFQDKYIWQDQELNTQGEGGGVLMSRLLAWMDLGAFLTNVGTEKQEPCEWWGKLGLALRCRCGASTAL